MFDNKVDLHLDPHALDLFDCTQWRISIEHHGKRFDVGDLGSLIANGREAVTYVRFDGADPLTFTTMHAACQFLRTLG